MMMTILIPKKKRISRKGGGEQGVSLSCFIRLQRGRQQAGS